jgi:hypothetical protein
LEALVRADELAADPAGPTVVLIGCGATKRPSAARAVDLYTGPLYRAHLSLLRSAGREPTHVLSALHGAVPAYRVIEPYEATVPSGADGREWGRRVLGALRPGPGARWLVLAGSAYVEPWIDEARRAGVDVLDPLRGLTLGERRSLSSRCEGVRECARVALGLASQEPARAA